jgi:uncharacterized protein YlxW (UPF0749 family)
MPTADSPRAPVSPGPAGEAPGVARLAFALVLALLAGLVVVSVRAAPDSAPNRIGRRVELAELIRVEQARVDALTARVADLRTQVDAQRRPVAGEENTAAALEAQIAEVLAPAQMVAVRGPGLVVTLDDATAGATDGTDYNNLVIHEQDLQAVVNGLWAGGAEAMSVAGERVLATTAIRCVGNVLLLHGRTYSPPFEIHAIGGQTALHAALQQDPTVARFQRAVNEFGLRFDIVASAELELPAYAGGVPMQVAEPAEAVAG